MTEDVLSRFSEKYSRTLWCWNWNAYKDKDGYGILRVGGKNIKAHRLSYQHWVGSIPEDMCCCHRCDNPSCVRPSHLFLATNEENTKDRVEKGRSAKGERISQSKLSESDVRKIKRLHHIKNQYVLADEYGVSQTTISNIIRGRWWRHVEV